MTDHETGTQIALMNRDIEQLRAEVQELRSDIKELVAAWNTASNFVSFIKWIAGAAGAITVIGGVTWEFWKK